MHTHNTNASKRKPPRTGAQAGWKEVIQDAEREIDLARARITRLKGVVRVCQRMEQAGEPFPADTESL